MSVWMAFVYRLSHMMFSPAVRCFSHADGSRSILRAYLHTPPLSVPALDLTAGERVVGSEAERRSIFTACLTPSEIEKRSSELLLLLSSLKRNANGASGRWCVSLTKGEGDEGPPAILDCSSGSCSRDRQIDWSST